jgi:adenylate kinase
MGVELDHMIPLVEYFITNGIEELVYDTTSKSENSIFESIRCHTERNGRPNNYLVDEKELVEKYLKVIDNQNSVAANRREENVKKDQKQRSDVETKRRNLAKEIIEMVENEGEEEIKKMPFRNYLMEFVVPTLNEGLLEVSNIIPNDPVDLLAEYLYQKSYDV